MLKSNYITKKIGGYSDRLVRMRITLCALDLILIICVMSAVALSLLFYDIICESRNSLGMQGYFIYTISEYRINDYLTESASIYICCEKGLQSHMVAERGY